MYFLPTIVGITLNIVSLSLYRTYVKERREKQEKYSRAKFNKNINENQATTSIEVTTGPKKVLTQKEINETKAESNMFKMALTLCSISTLSRFLIIFSYIYLFFFNFISNTLILLILCESIYTLVPTTAIFAFYFFNKMFRQEFQKKFHMRENVVSG